MIRVRSQRFWTTMLVLGLCAPTASLGWDLARYGLAAASAAPQTVELKLGPFVDNGSAFAALALRQQLRLREPADPRQAENAIAALLAETPMNGGAWLDLAIARRAAGDPVGNVATALAMSAVVSPNEARLMAGRATFALVFWSALPPDARSTLIADLIGGWNAIDSAERDRLSAILRTEPEGAGEEVRAALLTNSNAGAQVATALFPAALDTGSATSQAPEAKPLN